MSATKTTVADLISKLATWPADTPVVVNRDVDLLDQSWKWEGCWDGDVHLLSVQAAEVRSGWVPEWARATDSPETILVLS